MHAHPPPTPLRPTHHRQLCERQEEPRSSLVASQAALRAQAAHKRRHELSVERLRGPQRQPLVEQRRQQLLRTHTRARASVRSHNSRTRTWSFMSVLASGSVADANAPTGTRPTIACTAALTPIRLCARDGITRTHTHDHNTRQNEPATSHVIDQCRPHRHALARRQQRQRRQRARKLCAHSVHIDTTNATHHLQ
jgi:hypothetical protein